jgi:ElaB/YqjD/DUF883 family membrane-anchored ribosome-binding protein
MGGNAGSTSKDKLDGAAEHGKNLVDDGRALAGDLKDRLKETAGDAKDLMKHKLSDAKDVVVDAGGSALASSRRMIRQHPLAAIGLAFGVGFIAMRLMRR